MKLKFILFLFCIIFSQNMFVLANSKQINDNISENLFNDKTNRIVNAKQAISDIKGKYHLIDKDGKLIAELSDSSIGEGLYIFNQNDKTGVIDINGNIIVEPRNVFRIGKVVDGLFTIVYDDTYDIYNIKGEIIKSVKKPIGFSYKYGEYEYGLYDIASISGTNVIVREHVGDMAFEITPSWDYFIIRLMSEKKIADEFFAIYSLPNGEFSAVNRLDGKACILNKDGSLKIKTNYGELIYIAQNRFAAFKDKYSYYRGLDNSELCDIIDINGNIIKKDINNIASIAKNMEENENQSLYEYKLSMKKNEDYHITENNGEKIIVDKNGNIIKKVLNDIGYDLFTFKENDKIGVIDINGNIIVNPKYTDNGIVAGFGVSGLFTMREEDRYDVYNINGELIKSIEKPLNFSINNKYQNSKFYDIISVSGTNVVVAERLTDNSISSSNRDWFVIRLISELKAADNFFEINALPNGYFTAIRIDDMKACILGRGADLQLEPHYDYGQLYYIGNNKFAAFKNYDPLCYDYKKRNESYDIIDIYWNIAEKNIKS